MSYFQKHSKVSSGDSLDGSHINRSNQTYLNKFKKQPGNRFKTNDAEEDDPRQRTKENQEFRNQSRINKKQQIVNRKHAASNRESIVYKEPLSLNRQLPVSVRECPVQKPKISNFNAPCKQENQSVNKSLHNLMLDADNSMEELLNSSINQFEKYLEDKDIEMENNLLLQQNKYLKVSLDQLKLILKDKLENALKKQKEELTVMLEDYIKLITKLLKDKEDLTINIEQLQNQCKHLTEQCTMLEEKQTENLAKIQELAKDRDNHIQKTKYQIDEFLQIIEQYQEEAEQENSEREEMKNKLTYLQARVDECMCHQPSNHQHKIQTLLQLLEKAQEDNRQLQKQCESSTQISNLQQQYEARMRQLQQEHEEQFMEYEKAIKETISKKDECIERLTSIIEGIRNKKNSTKETSFESTLQMIEEPLPCQ